IVVLLRWGVPGGSRTPELLRGARREPIELLEPRGAVAALPRRFTWRGVPGATAYRLEVLDLESRSLFQKVTPAAGIELPSGALPDSLPAGRWRVVALDSRFVELGASNYLTFRVRGR